MSEDPKPPFAPPRKAFIAAVSRSNNALVDAKSFQPQLQDAIKELNSANKQKPVVESLVALREEYQVFCADNSRVASMRRMAAEFVLKLNAIIRESMKAPITEPPTEEPK